MMPADLAGLLARSLPPRATQWLKTAGATVTVTPTAVHELFPVAGRRCGRDELAGVSGALSGWRVDDAVRCLLLDMLPLSAPELLETVQALYAHGDAAERRGVLRALALLDRRPGFGAGAIPIVTDALRANDPRLIEAALGDYAARHLGAAEYRQAVLKSVFCGIPLARVAGLAVRADEQLARALTDYAREREAAGRDVPADAASLIAALGERTQADAIPAS